MESQPVEEKYCEHCLTITPHQCYYSTHERDSTDDIFECLMCNWYYTGLLGIYQPPQINLDD